MARRISNNHKIVKGAWKAKIPGTHSRTNSYQGKIYFAYPPVGGWPGGDPLKNGYKG